MNNNVDNQVVEDDDNINNQVIIDDDSIDNQVVENEDNINNRVIEDYDSIDKNDTLVSINTEDNNKTTISYNDNVDEEKLYEIKGVQDNTPNTSNSEIKSINIYNKREQNKDKIKNILGHNIKYEDFKYNKNKLKKYLLLQT